MPIRVALYSRYSTDLQRDSSIEDQLRLCPEYADRQAWTVGEDYADRAISGASLLRPGLQRLISDASRGRFDIVLAEAMNRLSRDQEDIASLFKRLTFAGVRIVTIAEGEISEMHIGLKGTMNALFLKDLAQKTHRGLRGRIEAGKSRGGNSYGVTARSIKEEMSALEAREDELNATLATQDTAAQPLLMPNLAEVYRDKVTALHELLANPSTRDEAFWIIRTLIDEVRLIPEDGQLRVELRGALAGILALANNDKNHLRVAADGSVSVLTEQMKLVAGARFERAAFRL